MASISKENIQGPQTESSMGSHCERAERNWKKTVAKTISIGFFSRHILDKSKQRALLHSFMMQMKNEKVEDEDELRRSRDEYENSSRPQNIHTCRRMSELAQTPTVPYPETPTFSRFELPPGTKCAICEQVFPVFREMEAYPCRICDDAFHKECLLNCGDLTTTDKINIELAKTSIGWSCPKCSNICLLLTAEEVKKMTEDFEKIDFNQDTQISIQEYLMHNARRPSLVNRRGQLRPEEERELTREFQLMDQNGDDRLDWWEFVNHESKRYLARKDKHELVAQLSKKELSAAKATFSTLDIDGDGKIKAYEAKEAFTKWFEQFEQQRNSKRERFKSQSDVLDLHATVFTQDIMESDTSATGELHWEDFILHQALYILCARPNLGGKGAKK